MLLVLNSWLCEPRPPAQDYTGPVLFEARAAAPMVAQVLGPALNGARPPISFSPVMEQMLSGLGGKSDWVSRLGSRVLPSGVSVVDDPGAKDFQRHAADRRVHRGQ